MPRLTSAYEREKNKSSIGRGFSLRRDLAARKIELPVPPQMIFKNHSRRFSLNDEANEVRHFAIVAVPCW